MALYLESTNRNLLSFDCNRKKKKKKLFPVLMTFVDTKEVENLFVGNINSIPVLTSKHEC